jgi:hypothetical protein
MILVTKYQIFLPSTVTEKNATKNILDGRKENSIPPSPFGEWGYKNIIHKCSNYKLEKKVLI